MRAALDEVDKLAKKASLFPESCRSENMANLVDAMASLAVRKSEISNRNITGKTSNSILRDCTVKACTLTRCELYNCTIQESRFFDSEIYECDFVTTGTHIRRYALTRCKIYSCRLVPYLDISNSEMHDSTISSYGFEKSQDAVDRTTGFGGLLPKGPSISRSELYRCVITWPSDTNKGDNGIAICKLFDCTLENPTIRRSKLRRCKITRSTLVYSGDNNNTTQAVEKSTLIACDIRRTCAYQCIMLECKLKYVVAWESHFEGCTIRKSGIVLSSTPPITVSKARENFPDIQAKYPEIDDDQSINFLAHLPLEIKARIMQYVAGSLKLKGGTPPLIEAVRGNHLLYSSALSAFAKKNWHSVRAANDNELTDERILSMKDWQDVRKLAIRNAWSGDCTPIIQKVPSLTSLELNLFPMKEVSPERTGSLIGLLRGLKRLIKISVSIYCYSSGTSWINEIHMGQLSARASLALFTHELDEALGVQSTISEMEDFPTRTWKAPLGSTLRFRSNETTIASQ